MQLTAEPMAEDSENFARGWERLTARELQIVERIAWEMSYREIGDEMGISKRTVEGYVNKSIFEKLEINDRKVLGRVARERGLGLKQPKPIPSKKEITDRT